MSTEPGKKGFKDRLPWIIAAVAVVALAVNLLWDRGRSTGAEDDAMAQLADRLDALEAGSAGDGRRAVVAPRVRPGMEGERAGSGTNMLDAMREQRTPEEMAADRDRQLRELEAQFAADAPDPATGPRTENILVETISSETMASTGLKPNDVDIACKQNSCRIVGTFDRMGDAQDWSLFYITAAGGDVLSQTRMVFVPRPGGKTEVRIYSSRAKG